jgi:predicted outer membrane protein
MRTLIVISVCASLGVFGLAACAQDQVANSGRQTLNAYSVVIPASNFDFEAAKRAEMNGIGLKIFTYGIDATKDQNIYSGAMVGSSPFARKKVTTNIPTYIIPVIVVIGATAFDPTVADTTCMTPPNDVRSQYSETLPYS